MGADAGSNSIGSLKGALRKSAPRLYSRFTTIEQRIAADLHPFATPGYFTDHGAKHAAAVQENLGRLLPTRMPEPLTPFELFALLLATALHDIGMVLPHSPGERLADVRLDHYIRSRNFIVKRHESLGLSEHEAIVVGELCRAHGMPNLGYLNTQHLSLRGHGSVRVQLLSALLRLADYLDLTADRAPCLIADSRVIPAESQRHWSLHRRVADVQIRPHPAWDITIISIPLKPTDARGLYELRNAIQAELDLLSPVLRGAGIFYKRVDLVVNTTTPDRSARGRKNPFLRLAPFGLREADLFAGRDKEIRQLVEKIFERQVVVLIGESGIGKTSLVEAGVIPQLRTYRTGILRFSFQRDPVGNLRSVLLGATPGPSPGVRADSTRFHSTRQHDVLGAVRDLLRHSRRFRRFLIIGDHLEQMFTVAQGDEARQAFMYNFARILGNVPRDRLTFLFCMRQDYLPDLHDLSRDIPELYDRNNTFKLQRLGREQALEALERASSYALAKLSPGVMTRIVSDLAHEGEGMVYPPFLQVVGYSVYASLGHRGSEPGYMIQESVYGKLGGAEAIVNRYLDGLLDGYAAADKPQVAQILGAMVTEYNTKKRMTKEELRLLLPACQKLDDFLEHLVDQRIVRRSLGEYELIHDFLVRRVLDLLKEQTFLSPPVRRAVSFIEANHQRPNLRSGEIAKAARVTQMHLAALCRRELGCSLNRQLNRARVATAKSLMAKTRDPLGLIARAAGFTSLASFSRKFAQIEGIPPLTYRKALFRPVAATNGERRAG